MSLAIHFGPMFSGKTTALIRAYKQCLKQNISVVCFKPKLDTRYSDDGEVVSHNRSRIPATFVDESNPNELLEKLNGESTVLIDEVQFFDSSIIQTIDELLAKMTQVIVAGLDLDYHRQEFGATLALAKLAAKHGGQVTAHTAKCDGCRKEAGFTYRKQNLEGQVLIGGAETYGPCCATCYESLHTV